MAPVILDLSLQRLLRSQLPSHMAAHYVCWYTPGDNSIIATSSKNPKTFNYGYTFNKHDGHWLLSEGSPVIMQVPRAIE